MILNADLPAYNSWVLGLETWATTASSCAELGTLSPVLSKHFSYGYFGYFGLLLKTVWLIHLPIYLLDNFSGGGGQFFSISWIFFNSSLDINSLSDE